MTPLDVIVFLSGAALLASVQFSFILVVALFASRVAALEPDS